MRGGDGAPPLTGDGPYESPVVGQIATFTHDLSYFLGLFSVIEKLFKTHLWQKIAPVNFEARWPIEKRQYFLKHSIFG